MKIIKNIEKIPEMPKPCGLTLGSFDGMHLGHQHLLDELKNLVGKGTAAVFTFSNHPSHILKNRQPTPLLCTLEHKLLLLKKAGVDLAIVQQFDEEFSHQPYDVFLKNVKKYYPFSLFVLGKGASFGKDKHGDEDHVCELAKKMKFKAHYLKKFVFNKQPISSGFIRNLISGGDLLFASKLLGRPFSVYTKAAKNPDNPDAFSLSLNGLCMPPQGSYDISALVNGKEYTGSASLDRSSSILNFKLNNCPDDPTDSMIEVFFQKYLSKDLHQ
jgi:riboflavin kinase / FMN adenylyltransferase